MGPGGKVCVIGLGLIGQLTIRLALASGLDVVGIDLGAAFSSKMIQNAEKYPVEASRGSAARPKPDRSLMR